MVLPIVLRAVLSIDVMQIEAAEHCHKGGENMSVAERTAVSPSARAVRLARVREIASAYVALTKPRIMLFLLFTAYSAMIVAHRGLPDIQSTIVCLIGLALSSGLSLIHI